MDDTINPSSPEEIVEALRRIAVFADLPEDQLKWFAGNVEELHLVPGDILFRKGAPADVLPIYLEGEVRADLNDQAHGGAVYMARAGDPKTEVSGMLPFSRMTEWSATGHVRCNMHVLLFPTRLFPEMMQRMPV